MIITDNYHNISDVRMVHVCLLDDLSLILYEYFSDLVFFFLAFCHFIVVQHFQLYIFKFWVFMFYIDSSSPPPFHLPYIQHSCNYTYYPEYCSTHILLLFHLNLKHIFNYYKNNFLQYYKEDFGYAFRILVRRAYHLHYIHFIHHHHSNLLMIVTLYCGAINYVYFNLYKNSIFTTAIPQNIQNNWKSY